jgi:hypothetical protein
MVCVVWKGGVPEKVLGKLRMKRKSIKFKLRCAERGGLKENGMLLRSTERGGCGSVEWN